MFIWISWLHSFVALTFLFRLRLRIVLKLFLFSFAMCCNCVYTMHTVHKEPINNLYSISSTEINFSHWEHGTVRRCSMLHVECWMLNVVLSAPACMQQKHNDIAWRQMLIIINIFFSFSRFVLSVRRPWWFVCVFIIRTYVQLRSLWEITKWKAKKNNEK